MIAVLHLVGMGPVAEVVADAIALLFGHEDIRPAPELDAILFETFHQFMDHRLHKHEVGIVAVQQEDLRDQAGTDLIRAAR